MYSLGFRDLGRLGGLGGLGGLGCTVWALTRLAVATINSGIFPESC